MGLEPGQRTLGGRRRREVTDGEVVPRTHLGEVAVQQGVADLLGGEVAEALERVGDGVQPGQDVDGGVLQPALVGAVGVVEPVVAEGVGQHVGRDDALDPVHEEAGGAEDLAGLLQPPHARDRHVGELADLADHLELVAEVVAREDREVLGGRGHAGDERVRRPLAALGPGRVEDQGLRGHAVGVDAAVQHDLGVGAVGEQRGQPPLQGRGHERGVPAAALHLQVGRGRLGRCCLGHTDTLLERVLGVNRSVDTCQPFAAGRAARAPARASSRPPKLSVVADHSQLTRSRRRSLALAARPTADLRPGR